jgi:uncharacterized membrane protein YfcA
LEANRKDSPHQNRWYWFLVGVAVTAIVGSVVLSVLPIRLSRPAIPWFAIPLAILMIVGVVGWAYTETRRQEKLGPRKSPSARILGYLEALAITAAIAVAATLAPARLTPAISASLALIALIVGWWRRRRHRRR